MFRKSYNRAVLTLELETVTPLLIRAGDAGLDPTAADLVSVRTHHGQRGLTVYVPGSSLKGVLRSAAEASIRGRSFIGPQRKPMDGACDPLIDRGEADKSCSARHGKAQRDLQREDSQEAFTARVYREHCLACRLFGSTAIKGRAAIRDLYPFPTGDWKEEYASNFRLANRLEERHGVAIDRVLGSVKVGPFDMELVPAGVRFYGEIALENYQTWQLGLLAQAMDEVNNGFAQLGSSKSRGLGVARLKVIRLIHEQSGKDDAPKGVGALAPGEVMAYDLFPESPLPACEGKVWGLYRRFDAPEPEKWLEAGLAALGGLA